MQACPLPAYEEGIDARLRKNCPKDGVFSAKELIDLSAKKLLDELVKWATALKPRRP